MNLLKYLFISLIFFTASQDIFPLPRFALRLKDKCINCHVNPSGGIIRNENGWYFGKYVISMVSPREKDFKLSQMISDNISFGFDYRMQLLYSGEKKKGDFHDMTGSIYTNVDLSEDINVIARYDFIQAIWEAYGVARILPNDSYIKAGTFQPYYGIRLDDHTSYTRGGDYQILISAGKRGLLYDPFYAVTGLELGINIGKISTLTVSAGRTKFHPFFASDPTLTGRVEIMPSIGKLGFSFGGSVVSTNTFLPQVTLNSKIYGGFLGVGYDRFAIMGEYDIARDYIKSDQESSAIMAKVSYQILVGLEGVVRYDKFNPNTAADNDELAHLVLGFEFFPYSFIELRPQYRIYIEEPKVDNNAFVLQFHFWY